MVGRTRYPVKDDSLTAYISARGGNAPVCDPTALPQLLWQTYNPAALPNVVGHRFAAAHRPSTADLNAVSTHASAEPDEADGARSRRSPETLCGAAAAAAKGARQAHHLCDRRAARRGHGLRQRHRPFGHDMALPVDGDDVVAVVEHDH